MTCNEKNIQLMEFLWFLLNIYHFFLISVKQNSESVNIFFFIFCELCRMRLSRFYTYEPCLKKRRSLQRLRTGKSCSPGKYLKRNFFVVFLCYFVDSYGVLNWLGYDRTIRFCLVTATLAIEQYFIKILIYFFL